MKKIKKKPGRPNQYESGSIAAPFYIPRDHALNSEAKLAIDKLLDNYRKPAFKKYAPGHLQQELNL